MITKLLLGSILIKLFFATEYISDTKKNKKGQDDKVYPKELKLMPRS